MRLPVQADVGPENAEIFAVHEAYLTDPELLSSVRLMRDRVAAEQAVRDEIDDAVKRIAAIDDPHLSERAVDIRDVGRRLLSSLSPDRVSDCTTSSRSVLVAVELFFQITSPGSGARLRHRDRGGWRDEPCGDPRAGARHGRYTWRKAA